MRKIKNIRCFLFTVQSQEDMEVNILPLKQSYSSIFIRQEIPDIMISLDYAK